MFCKMFANSTFSDHSCIRSDDVNAYVVPHVEKTKRSKQKVVPLKFLKTIKFEQEKSKRRNKKGCN